MSTQHFELVVPFDEPLGIPYEFYDLADSRGPFFAYGGPENYADGFKGCPPDVNLMAARLMVREGKDRWQLVQAGVVRALRYSTFAADKWLRDCGAHL